MRPIGDLENKAEKPVKCELESPASGLRTNFGKYNLEKLTNLSLRAYVLILYEMSYKCKFVFIFYEISINFYI